MMMKRVGLSRFSPLEVSRKVQQCLRFQGVNANGVLHSDRQQSTEIVGASETNDQISGARILTDGCCDNTTRKSNLLSAIKRKLKKAKRNKRCESRSRSDSMSNMCPCLNENCVLLPCKSNLRTRKQKLGEIKTWPVASSVLRNQNHQNCDVSELIQSHSVDDNEVCNSFPGPSENLNGTMEEQNNSLFIDPTSTISESFPNICDLSKASQVLTVDADLNLNASCAVEVYVDSSIYATTVCNDIAKLESMVADTVDTRIGNLTQELYKLSKYGWYWGPINRSEAESKLVDQSDGAFLVRDSSDDRYILSLSFRSYGKTLHTRIEHSNGLFSFYAYPEPEGNASVIELIQQSMCSSQSGVFCYSRSRSPGSPSFPVRLTKPISRFTRVRSLQYLCRFVIRQFTRYDHIQKLPLPTCIKGYLEEGHY